jgi:hypothetical protein
MARMSPVLPRTNQQPHLGARASTHPAVPRVTKAGAVFGAAGM